MIVVVEVDLDESVVDSDQFVPVAEEYDVQEEVIDVPEGVMVDRTVTPERYYVVGLVDLVVELDVQLVADFEGLEEVVSGDLEVARDGPEVVMAVRVPEADLENLVADYLGREVVVG